MPLPDETCEAASLPDACCTSLWDMMHDVLETVVPFMEECIVPSDCTPPMRYFISVGRPEAVLRDFLALYLENMVVDQGSQRSGATLPFPIILGQFRFLLYETGYPFAVQQGETIYVPTDTEYHQASRHSYAHAQALLRGLLTYADSGLCKKFVLRDLQPLRQEANNIGWSLGFSLQMP